MSDEDTSAIDAAAAAMGGLSSNLYCIALFFFPYNQASLFPVLPTCSSLVSHAFNLFPLSLPLTSYPYPLPQVCAFVFLTVFEPWNDLYLMGPTVLLGFV